MAFVVLLLALVGGLPEPNATTLSADVDGDGRRDTLRFHAAADGTRAFVSVAGGPTSPLYPAWKALAGRLDAGTAELVVLGTWTRKRTRAGEPARRSLWVVGLEHGRWVERWRGSALARPFVDYTLSDLDGDGVVELLVRECEAGERFTAYAWDGFGFTGKARGAGQATCAGEVDWRRVQMRGGRLWLGR